MNAATRKRSLHASRRRVYLAALVVLGLILALGSWIWARAGHIATSDARIAADVVAVSSEVAGRIVELSVRPGDRVRKGALMARIEVREAQYALQELEASMKALEARRAELRAQQELVRQRLAGELGVSAASVEGARAEYLARQADLASARNAFERTRTLFQKGLVAQSRFDEDQARLRAAEQNAARAQANIQGAQAGTRVTRTGAEQIEVIERQISGIVAQVEGLRAKQDQLRLNLERREIRAAFDGVIDQTFVDAGEYVAPGTRILLYHDPDAIWVDVNVKETEFRKLRVGASAQVRVDAFPGRTFQAFVDRIGGAATSQFALLPNPNPSGNFTKVTQRLPVRLRIRQQDSLLRPGMMVEVTIDAAD